MTLLDAKPTFQFCNLLVCSLYKEKNLLLPATLGQLDDSCKERLAVEQTLQAASKQASKRLIWQTPQLCFVQDERTTQATNHKSKNSTTVLSICHMNCTILLAVGVKRAHDDSILGRFTLGGEG